MLSSTSDTANTLNVHTFLIISSPTVKELYHALSHDAFFTRFNEALAEHGSGDQTPSPQALGNVIERPSETISELGNKKDEALALVEALETHRRILDKSKAYDDDTRKQDLEKCSTYQGLLNGLSDRFSDLAQLIDYLVREGRHKDATLCELVCQNVREAGKWLGILRERVFEF